MNDYLMDIVIRVNNYVGSDQSGREVFHAMGKYVNLDQNLWIQIGRGGNVCCADNRDPCPQSVDSNRRGEIIRENRDL